jgi:hypothetical protein
VPDNKNQEEAGGATVTRESSPIYTVEGLGRELRQSEIVTNLRQYVFDPVAGEGIEIVHEHAIILTQDCDLLWDFEARANGNDSDLNGVLVHQVDPAVAALSKLSGSDLRRRVKQNRDERYHFLEAIQPSADLLRLGMQEMVVDFKKYFTLPPDEIYRQCAIGELGAKRRCRLETPYREHPKEVRSTPQRPLSPRGRGTSGACRPLVVS